MTPTTPENPPMPPTRKRAPTYDVWRLQHRDLAHWIEVATGVQAPNRRDAIRAAAETLPEDERYGTFAVVRSGELTVETRERIVETRDAWT